MARHSGSLSRMRFDPAGGFHQVPARERGDRHDDVPVPDRHNRLVLAGSGDVYAGDTGPVLLGPAVGVPGPPPFHRGLNPRQADDGVLVIRTELAQDMVLKEGAEFSPQRQFPLISPLPGHPPGGDGFLEGDVADSASPQGPAPSGECRSTGRDGSPGVRDREGVRLEVRIPSPAPDRMPSAESNVSAETIFASSTTTIIWSACAPSIFSGVSGEAASASPCRNLSFVFMSSVRSFGTGRPIFSQSTRRAHLVISRHRYDSS